MSGGSLSPFLTLMAALAVLFSFTSFSAADNSQFSTDDLLPEEILFPMSPISGGSFRSMEDSPITPGPINRDTQKLSTPVAFPDWDKGWTHTVGDPVLSGEQDAPCQSGDCTENSSPEWIRVSGRGNSGCEFCL